MRYFYVSGYSFIKIPRREMREAIQKDLLSMVTIVEISTTKISMRKFHLHENLSLTNVAGDAVEFLTSTVTG